MKPLKLDGADKVLTFSQAAILYRKAGKSGRFLDIVGRYWKDTPVRIITAGAIRQAAIEIYPDAAGATRNRQVIAPTQAIINHAATLDLCKPISVRRFPVEKKEKTPVTWEWVQDFMAHAEPELGALCCFMFLTGARISEALSVQWSDVDLAGRTVLIRQTKTSSERRSHLPPPLLAALANLERRLGRVFGFGHRNEVKSPWGRVVRKAGIAKLSPHCCRHGFATSMLQAGVDIVTVAKLGGWKSAQHVFETYGHAMDDATLTDRIISTP